MRVDLGTICIQSGHATDRDAMPSFRISIHMPICSVVPMIDYSRKSFIYMQPIIDRLEFWESIIIGKILKQKKFNFI